MEIFDFRCRPHKVLRCQPGGQMTMDTQKTRVYMRVPVFFWRDMYKLRNHRVGYKDLGTSTR
jgi:hypothetical protein